MDNYILTYYQQIEDGTVTVGNWIRLAYKYLVQGLEEGLFRYDAKKANSQIRFIEKHCHHVEGKLAPKTFKLEIWQKAAIAAIFGIVDDKGLRQFREIVMVEGRKCGKSLMGASIGECVLFFLFASGTVMCCSSSRRNILYVNLYVFLCAATLAALSHTTSFLPVTVS